MVISDKAWENYIAKMRMLNEEAAKLVAEYVRTHDISDAYELAKLQAYAYGIAQKYGEGSAALSAQMYDAIADLSDAYVPPAVPAKTATYGETVKTVRGAAMYSKDPDYIGSAVGRLVKQAGVDTTMQNAIRDGAYWAWIPKGDTCAFCLTLASRGWQRASKKALKNGHAEHIHSNCDCTYAIRFGDDLDVEGYDPEKYEEWYYSEPGSPNSKINAMRRELYAKNKDAINAQKRAAYARRNEEE